MDTYLTILAILFAIGLIAGYWVGKKAGYENGMREGRLQGVREGEHIPVREKEGLLKHLDSLANAHDRFGCSTTDDIWFETSDPARVMLEDLDNSGIRVPGLPSAISRYYRDLLIIDLPYAKKRIAQRLRTRQKAGKKLFKQDEKAGFDESAPYETNFEDGRLSVRFVRNPSPWKAYRILKQEMIDLIRKSGGTIEFVGEAVVPYGNGNFTYIVDQSGYYLRFIYHPERKALRHSSYGDEKVDVSKESPSPGHG